MRYPYFQTIRLLYLKNLFILGDKDFKSELQKSALYIADLSVLFYFIEGNRLAITGDAAHQNPVEKENGTDRTLDLIDRFLSDLPEPLGNDLPLPAEANVDYISVLMQEKEAQEEKHPFSVLMQEKEAQEEKHPLKGQELIDRFIEHSESEKHLPLAQDEKKEEAPKAEDDMPDESSKEPEREETEADEQYFTETLAKIKKLNLQYPKKNAYFADQIRFLEKLIINAKSK